MDRCARQGCKQGDRENCGTPASSAADSDAARTRCGRPRRKYGPCGSQSPPVSTAGSSRDQRATVGRQPGSGVVPGGVLHRSGRATMERTRSVRAGAAGPVVPMHQPTYHLEKRLLGEFVLVSHDGREWHSFAEATTGSEGGGRYCLVVRRTGTGRSGSPATSSTALPTRRVRFAWAGQSPANRLRAAACFTVTAWLRT